MKIIYYKFEKNELIMVRDEAKQIYEHAIQLKKNLVESEFYIPDFLIVSEATKNAVLAMVMHEGRFFPLPLHGRTPRHLLRTPIIFSEYNDDEKVLDENMNQLRQQLKTMLAIFNENKLKEEVKETIKKVNEEPTSSESENDKEIVIKVPKIKEIKKMNVKKPTKGGK